jgi:hypothetical protein
MTPRHESAEVQGLRVYAYVSRLAESGATPDEIRQKLIEKGVDAQEARRRADRLAASEAKKQIRARAISLLAQGVTSDQIQAQLGQQGFAQALVAEEVNALLTERAREEAERREDPRRLWRLLGAALLVAGVALYIGNKTGAFPTFPYAGGILMGVGALVSAMGWLRSA